MDELEREETFNPTMALAHFRELEALMNLELINNLEWQERRAKGDTSFLLDSRYFAEQNRLMEEADRQGYNIFALEDDEDENSAPIWVIEPKDQELPASFYLWLNATEDDGGLSQVLPQE